MNRKICVYNGQCCRSQELRNKRKENETNKIYVHSLKDAECLKIDQKYILYCIIEIVVD